ncbi:MAG: TatD family hydrolase [Terriglobia bacterium]
MSLLVDSHCHIAGPDFDADRDAVIERARAAGLRYLLVVPSGEPAHLGEAQALAERHDGMYAAAGIHPHEAAKATGDDFTILEKVAARVKLLAIGEIGLDYYYDHSPREVQQAVFRRQLILAHRARLPVIIHCRDAWQDFRQIFGEFLSQMGLGGARWRGGILHCFTGTLEDARELMEMGFMVSFAGNLTFKKAEPLREVARQIPLDRLLAETDSPFLSPAPFRGQRNEPMRVREITKQLAELHGLSEEEMGVTLVRNFEHFFGLQVNHKPGE